MIGANSPGEAEDNDKLLIDSLRSNPSFEVWKYFEERADKLADQLWSTGTWLMALLGATLSLPFAAKFIDGPYTFVANPVKDRLPVVGIAIFGIVLCWYSFVALLDMRRHIEDNWRRALYARTGEWKVASLGRRRRHGWRVLLCFGVLAFLAFFLLLLLAVCPDSRL